MDSELLILLDFEISFVQSVFDENKDVLNIRSRDLRKHLMIVPLQGGSTNVNYKVEIGSKTYFLKHQREPIVTGPYKDSIEREYDISLYLSTEFGIAPFPIVKDVNNRVFISEFVKGRTPRSTDKDFFNTLALIGHSLNIWREVPIDILKRLNTGTRICPLNFFHDVILPKTGNLATQLLKEGSPRLFQFLEEISCVISDRLKFEPMSDCQIDWELYKESPKEQPYGLLHNDLALRNIIITEDQNSPIFFIDWEMADFGDISFDLAYLQSENMILQDQIDIITNFGNFHPYIKERTKRYSKIFLPMLELANAYWAINHISSWVENSGEKKIKLRPPYSLFQNLNFIRNKIKRLERLTSLNEDYQRELDLFNELQYALKIFESQLTIE